MGLTQSVIQRQSFLERGAPVFVRLLRSNPSLRPGVDVGVRKTYVGESEVGILLNGLLEKPLRLDEVVARVRSPDKV